MWYEINVAKSGTHFFATAQRSITSVQKLVEVYKDILNAFHGLTYDITVSEWKETGNSVDMAELFKQIEEG